MDSIQAGLLAKEFAVDKKLIEVLIQRGYDTREKMSAFLYPSFDDLTDAHKYVGYDAAVERIKQAIDSGEKVLIYGDYDCDGVCGTSILYNFLKSKGVDANCFLPNRHTDGYGLSIETLEKLAEEHLSDLLITVDCGITAVEEVEYAREVLGFDVIITDHHEQGEVLPDCIIFNPKLSGEDCYRELCGAGVALRLVEGLGGIEEMKKYLDIAAIATVADVVPLTYDNRIIAYYGLKVINSFNARRGIKMLVKSCVEGDVSSYDIAFKIAPRINSLGRLSDANAVLDLFCTDDNFLLENIVKELNDSNSKRMELTNDLTDYCMEIIRNYDFDEKPAIVLSNAYWDDGIIGIVASRITETFNRPTILITKSGEVFRGSGRSIKGINIHKYVSKCEDLLIKFGGHAMACGLSLKKENIDAFSDRLNQLILADYPMSYFIPHKRYDIDMSEIDSSLDMARGLKMLEPFGEGNPSIKFKESISSKDFRQMGVTQHIVCRENDKETVFFGGLKYREFLSQSERKDIYCSLSLQSFRDRVFAQAKVQSIECKTAEEQGDYMPYLMTGFFGGEKYGEDICLDDAISMSNKEFSTCFVCYDIDTYNDFCAKIKGSGKDVEVENRCSANYAPLTKIIFAPLSVKELGFYKNIVLLDEPLGYNIFKKSLSKHTKLYCLGNNGIIKKLSAFLPDYTKLSKIFVVIRDTLKTRDIYGISDLYYAIAKITDLEYNEFVLSAVVLADLGILKMSGKLYIDTAVKTKLSESRIYKLIEG